MKVQVKPIERKKWHGKTGKESFTRPIKIQALVDSDTNMFKTGLDHNKKTYDHPNEDKKITEAKYYGLKLGQNLSAIYNPNEPHDFWETKAGTIKLSNQTIILNTNNPMDYVKYKIMRGSKYVANSQKDLEKGLYPDATHLIYSEEEEVEGRATKQEIRNKCVIEGSKISKEHKRQIILLILGKNLKNKSDRYFTVRFNEAIEKDCEKVLEYIQMTPEVRATKALVHEGLEKGHLREEGHKIKYMDFSIGDGVEGAVDYLLQPDNQELKIKIKELVE